MEIIFCIIEFGVIILACVVVYVQEKRISKRDKEIDKKNIEINDLKKMNSEKLNDIYMILDDRNFVNTELLKAKYRFKRDEYKVFMYGSPGGDGNEILERESKSAKVSEDLSNFMNRPIYTKRPGLIK